MSEPIGIDAVSQPIGIDAVPELPADPSALIAAADEMAAQAGIVADRTTAATKSWSTLRTSFDTPDTVIVTAAMSPALRAAGDFDDALSGASTALRTLGETLTSLSLTRKTLLHDIAQHWSDVNRYRALHADAPEGPHATWGPHQHADDEALGYRCDNLRRRINHALEECEHDLTRIPDGYGFANVARANDVTAPPPPSWGEQTDSFVQALSLRILQRLGSNSADDIADLLKRHPDWQRLLTEHPPAADQVNQWWQTLDADTAAALAAGASRIIGNLDGVPYSARDTANRTQLRRDIETAQRELDELLAAQRRHRHEHPDIMEAKSIADAQEQLNSLQSIDAALGAEPGRAPRSLLSLTADHPPLAAVSVGDVDTAADVSLTVPGMGTTTADMKEWTRGAQQLFDEESNATDSHDHAVVAWIGYRTPPIPLAQGGFEVQGNDLAEVGGNHLADALAGIAAVRTEDRPALNVVAHSYGTTTAACALRQPDSVQVDTFISVGSAGLPLDASSASDLHADRVYAGQARDVSPMGEHEQGDQWAWVGRRVGDHPVNPVAPSFGATVFGVDGDNGMHPVTDHAALVPGGEGWGYLDAGTESLRNIGRALLGRDDELSPALPRRIYDPREAPWTD